MIPDLYLTMATLAELVLTEGDGQRIRIHAAIREIARARYGGDVPKAKNALVDIKRHASEQFYFEGASEGVIHDFAKEKKWILQIDGIWFTQILWMNAPEKDSEPWASLRRRKHEVEMR